MSIYYAFNVFYTAAKRIPANRSKCIEQILVCISFNWKRVLMPFKYWPSIRSRASNAFNRKKNVEIIYDKTQNITKQIVPIYLYIDFLCICPFRRNVSSISYHTSSNIIVASLWWLFYWSCITLSPIENTFRLKFYCDPFAIQLCSKTFFETK